MVERVLETCLNRKRELYAIIDIVSLDRALSEILGVEVTHLEKDALMVGPDAFSLVRAQNERDASRPA